MNWTKKVTLGTRRGVAHYATVYVQDTGEMTVGVGMGVVEAMLPGAVDEWEALAKALSEGIRKSGPGGTAA